MTWDSAAFLKALRRAKGVLRVIVSDCLTTRTEQSVAQARWRFGRSYASAT